MSSDLNTKNIKYLVLSVLLLVASVSFLKTTLVILKSNQRFENLRDEVAELERERAYITEELEYQKSPEFVETEARNKLNMLKPNERVYVFEDESGNPVVLGQSVTPAPTPPIKSPNWKLWTDLLF